MKFINAGARPGQRHVDSDAVFTIPNILTVVRFMGVPLFIWLVLGPKEYALATIVLVVMGSTDWVDGYIARRFNQTSRLGRIMDPIADRMALIAVAVTLVIAGVVEWWYLTALVVPDAILMAVSLYYFHSHPDLPVSRISHGVRAIEDPALVEEIAAREIVLEVCPTSNVATGVFASYEEHPLRTLYEAGVKLTLGSDDPPYFGCSIGGEYAVAQERFGFEEGELRTITRTAVQGSFADDAVKAALDAFRRRLPGAVRDDPDALLTYGALLAQAHRLADQLVQD